MQLHGPVCDAQSHNGAEASCHRSKARVPTTWCSSVRPAASTRPVDAAEPAAPCQGKATAAAPRDSGEPVDQAEEERCQTGRGGGDVRRQRRPMACPEQRAEASCWKTHPNIAVRYAEGAAREALIDASETDQLTVVGCYRRRAGELAAGRTRCLRSVMTEGGTPARACRRRRLRWVRCQSPPAQLAGGRASLMSGPSADRRKGGPGARIETVVWGRRCGPGGGHWACRPFSATALFQVRGGLVRCRLEP